MSRDFELRFQRKCQVLLFYDTSVCSVLSVKTTKPFKIFQVKCSKYKITTLPVAPVSDLPSDGPRFRAKCFPPKKYLQLARCCKHELVLLASSVKWMMNQRRIYTVLVRDNKTSIVQELEIVQILENADVNLMFQDSISTENKRIIVDNKTAQLNSAKPFTC